jgi:hypothetical protein
MKTTSWSCRKGGTKKGSSYDGTVVPVRTNLRTHALLSQVADIVFVLEFNLAIHAVLDEVIDWSMEMERGRWFLQLSDSTDVTARMGNPLVHPRPQTLPVS